MILSSRYISMKTQNHVKVEQNEMLIGGRHEKMAVKLGNVACEAKKRKPKFIQVQRKAKICANRMYKKCFIGGIISTLIIFYIWKGIIKLQLGEKRSTKKKKNWVRRGCCIHTQKTKSIPTLLIPFSNLAPYAVLTVKKYPREWRGLRKICKIESKNNKRKKGGPNNSVPSELSTTWHHSCWFLTRCLMPHASSLLHLVHCPLGSAKRHAPRCPVKKFLGSNCPS